MTGKFKLRVMNPDKTLFEGPVGSVFVQGDKGEFELLAYHYPLMSILAPGRIIIDWQKYIPVKSGIIKFSENDCIAIVEL
ncbi:MAG TPA: hypothetical protein PKY78_01210 [Candidatus Omnitrophota bacterium]|nr:hypothetical protein [Candidatus Omnitrophota bacterium]HPS19598.1 hypothetical protein [Candidatus Omnitrophota bacterium]